MKFSVVMPCYLGFYNGAASNREDKLERAVESVLAQEFEDWELVVVSDGCDKTVEIVKPYMYEYLPKIKLYKIPKQKLWSGMVRSTGIAKSEGDYICYLDSDDKFGSKHLQIINDNLADYDWVWFNDWSFNVKQNRFDEHQINIKKQGQCGTSNICHKSSLNAFWTDNTYRHDFMFIQRLKALSNNYNKIPIPEYQICHVPALLDV